MYLIAGNFSEFETLMIFASRHENTGPQESGSNVICSGHAHAIAAMCHIVRAMQIGLIVKVRIVKTSFTL